MDKRIQQARHEEFVLKLATAYVTMGMFCTFQHSWNLVVEYIIHSGFFHFHATGFRSLILFHTSGESLSHMSEYLSDQEDHIQSRNRKLYASAGGH